MYFLIEQLNYHKIFIYFINTKRTKFFKSYYNYHFKCSYATQFIQFITLSYRCFSQKVSQLYIASWVAFEENFYFVTYIIYSCSRFS